MNETQENFAIALKLEQWLGTRAPAYIAEQVGAVALAHDAAGLARWQAIAATYDQLQRAGRQ